MCRGAELDLGRNRLGEDGVVHTAAGCGRVGDNAAVRASLLDELQRLRDELDVARDLKRQQEAAAALLLAALVHRAGGVVTLLSSDLKAAGAFNLIRGRVGAGDGVRFKVVKKPRSTA